MSFNILQPEDDFTVQPSTLKKKNTAPFDGLELNTKDMLLPITKWIRFSHLKKTNNTPPQHLPSPSYSFVNNQENFLLIKETEAN